MVIGERDHHKSATIMREREREIAIWIVETERVWRWNLTRSNNLQFAQIGRSTSSSSGPRVVWFRWWSTSCLVSMVVHELCGGDGGDGVRKARERGGRGKRWLKMRERKKERKKEYVIRVRVLIFIVGSGGCSTTKG